MASEETVSFSAPHAPHENAIKAYGNVLDNIKQAVEENRELWRATPEMWSRAEGITTDKLLGDLTADSIGKYLVEIRSGPTSYGTILLGKIKIPNFKDDLGEGFLHVRIHDSPGDGTNNVTYHSLWTDEGNKNADGQATTWRAIQTKDTPLEFFNE